MTGAEVIERFKAQLQCLDFAHEPDRAVQVVPVDGNFAVLTRNQKRFEARSLIVATGARPKRLTVPGESLLIGRSLSYSALSHAPLFVDRKVALVGQGTRALRGAAELALVARHLLLVLPDQDLSSPLGMRLAENPKVQVLRDFEVQEIVGRGSYVHALRVRHNRAVREFEIEGLFVELGMVPNSQMVAELARLDPERRIAVDTHLATNCAGLFAAGDVTNAAGEQVLIAVGDGARAALSVYDYLLDQA